MFKLLEIKNEGPGRFSSVVVHIIIVALILLAGAAVHQIPVAHQVFLLENPPSLPVPYARPTVMHSHKELGGRSFGTPALITAGAPVIAPVRHEAVQPVLPAKIGVPSVIELPQVNLHAVVLAPQVKAAGFGGTVDAGGQGPHGTVTGAGFGQGVGQGSARDTGKVMRTGFEVAEDVQPAMAMKMAPVTSTLPRIVSIPKAHASDGINGQVEVRVCLRADGTVTVMGVVKRLRPDLDSEAERVASHVVFEPATKDGRPVDHISIVVVEFLFS